MSGQRGRLFEVARLFTRLGFTSFGGPAAHIALIRDEVVTRRSWVGEQEFLDLVGAANMIPGPTSTELTIHVGRTRAGWPGLLLAGACFIAPGMLIVLALAWAYVEYGTTPEAEALLYGIAPVVIAIVALAIWNLGRTAVRDVPLAITAAAAIALAFWGLNEIVLIFGTGLVVMIVRNAALAGGWRASAVLPWPWPWLWPWLRPEVGPGIGPASLLAAATAEVAVTYWRLFLTFLKIGTVLFGSGYVLFAFLRSDFVDHLGWLTQQQLLDAVAVGQLTPGPLFTTATFIGYLVLGVPGAIVATVGIFLPSFAFVAATGPLIPRIRRSRWLGAALDGVNVAAVALMVRVTWQLGLDAIVDVPTALIALASALVLLVWRPNAVWLLIAGGGAGLLVEALR